jgi:hypothetical protein
MQDGNDKRLLFAVRCWSVSVPTKPCRGYLSSKPLFWKHRELDSRQKRPLVQCLPNLRAGLTPVPYSLDAPMWLALQSPI